MQTQVKRSRLLEETSDLAVRAERQSGLPYRFVASPMGTSPDANPPTRSEGSPQPLVPQASFSLDTAKPVLNTAAPPLPAQQAVVPDSQKRAFPAPAELPTQIGPRGIRFDGNEGCRVALPDGSWQVRLSDIDTGNILFETVIGKGFVRTRKRYFCRFRIEIWDQSLARTEESLVLCHEYDASEKSVLIQFPIGTLGDTMGWFPYAEKFRATHGCRLTCAMAERIIPLFRDVYPDITFVTHEEVQPETYYATYNIGLYFNDDHIGEHQPCDFRLVGLHRTAGHILGVDPTEVPPRIAFLNQPRPIDEPYVVIATQSTTQAKYWNNPSGWLQLVRYLKQCGYRVVCIDQKPVHGGDLIWNHIPHGVEDQTGDRPLAERAHWLRHAEFFIGLSSGLSWLAWASGTPVVLISGFTHPINEFTTPYRVINYNVCNSCWNDMRIQFDHKDFLWCPRQKGTPRQFECTRLITFEHVKAVLRKIPGFLGIESTGTFQKSEVEAI